MPAPSYEQIVSFDNVTKQLQQAATDEFMEYVYDGITVEEVIDAAATVAAKFSMLGCELGAQWYDLCAELAGVDAEPAEYGDVDYADVADHARSSIGDGGDAAKKANLFLQNIIDQSIRQTGYANLWRDYERGMGGGRYCRVPVGETCAWCLMLASQGAWYLTEESALGKEADHYHDGCNCKAVFFADAEDIEGYDELQEYKRMYYDAENARLANNTGRNPYPEELKERIAAARAEHDAKYDASETDAKWTRWNETLIVMRYENGLK